MTKLREGAAARLKLILLSGGSGKRLWPLSNDTRSKQFLKLLRNQNGEKESMLQRVWRQIDLAGLSNECTIATAKSQVDMIKSQINDFEKIVVEPERRDTFPAIALAALSLFSKEKIDFNEVIVVLPVDPYVEDGFFLKIKQLESILHDSRAELALIGVNPTYPSEKYGYIVPIVENTGNEFFQVNSFKEKPQVNEAQGLIEKKALWNCGVFAFKFGYLFKKMTEMQLPLTFEELEKNYSKLQKISFDYEIVEKCTNIVVYPYHGIWKDLGTWNTLTEEMSEPLLGKGIISKDSHDTYLINELDIPVMVLGLSETIVAASPDGILITGKDASSRVKELAGGFVGRPMYEERRWGWYKVLDYCKKPDGNAILTKRIYISAGKNISYQVHRKRSEIWTIIHGKGELILNGKISLVRSGDVIKINIGDKHGIKALYDLEFIEVQMGTELIEEDIERISMTYNEGKII